MDHDVGFVEREKALEIFRGLAAELLEIDPDRITESARFKEDLDADSLDLIEVVMALEEQLGVRMPEEDLIGVQTVGEALTTVLAKLGSEKEALE